MKKLFLRAMLFLLGLIALITLIIILFVQQDKFGAVAHGERLLKMESKSNYKNGAFDNIEITPALSKGTSYPKMLREFFFAKSNRNVPKDLIPVEINDLKALSPLDNIYIWFGHSSYLIQLDGKRILIDPVFSPYASPLPGSIKAFASEYSYKAEDMPDIDILVLTHDHWDHLDYDTFLKLKHRIKHVVTGLGVGQHLEKWGYPTSQITELYWGDEIVIEHLKFTSATARHFSGRTFKRNVTLWSSFVLEGKSKKIYLGGDSGYGKHFKTIGQEHGPFDLAILENGQYNLMWKYIHMMPDETIAAAMDLGAKYTIPVHSSKFPLANHAWDEPLILVSKAAKENNVPLLTPKIGQIISLDQENNTIAWWENIK